MQSFDAVVIGAGWSGAVLAGELARAGQKILVIERRFHIGGNCHDYMDGHGIRVHTYGPHLFHTDYENVWNYLSKYTEWTPYQHRVLGNIDGKLVPIPFNLETIAQVFSPSMASRLEEKLVSRFGYGAKVPILKLREEKDADLEVLATFIYDKVFKNYTAKQWGMSPEEIDPAVTARVPVLVSRDGRYFQDRFQALPKDGYTKVFENILQHENIKLMLGTDFKDLLTFDGQKFTLFGQSYEGKVIYTGQIDELFDFKYGELSYRSLRFAYDQMDMDFYQPTTTVNYPNEFDFTRITEYKHISARPYPGKTLVMREYPQEYVRGDAVKGVPYYPIFTDEHKKAYELYAKEAEGVANLLLIGRLAEYKYYDQDDAIYSALAKVKNLI